MRGEASYITLFSYQVKSAMRKRLVPVYGKKIYRRFCKREGRIVISTVGLINNQSNS